MFPMERFHRGFLRAKRPLQSQIWWISFSIEREAGADSSSPRAFWQGRRTETLIPKISQETLVEMIGTRLVRESVLS